MTTVIGHRGASADFAENTIAAFEGARAQGADWVELDVRCSLDGQLVVRHDPTLADGRVVAETDRADMGVDIPLLAEALAACAPMGVNVEIKNSPHEPGHDPSQDIARRTLEVIRSTAAPVEVLISSFERPTLEAVRRLDPDMATGLLVYTPTDSGDAVDQALELGCVALHPHHAFVTEELVARCHDVGLRVSTWTVDDPVRVAELGRWGVDAVITNVPASARRALAG